MNICVRSKYKEFRYNSNIIPKENDFLYFPHFGTFKVKKIIHYISDDSENNRLMFIDVYVSEVKDYEIMAL